MMDIRRTDSYPWDAADYLESKEDIAAYLEVALEDGDPDLMVAVLEDIARSKGMSQLTHDSGLNPENILQSLANEGAPELSTVFEVVRALGLRLTTTAV